MNAIPLGTSFLQGGAGGLSLQPAAGSPQHPAGVSALAGGGNIALPSTQAPQPHVAAPSTPTPGTGSSFNSPEYLNGIQQEYGSSIRASQNQLAPLSAEYGQQVGNVNQLAGAQLNDLAAKYNGAMNTLETQKSGTQAQQQLSLAELADQIRGQNQGLMNQLGASGAGFSSAVGQGQHGLAAAQNQQRANIQQQAGTNVANINAEEQATTADYQPQMDEITSWKQGQLYQLMTNYNNTMAQLQGAIGQAQGEEKARLATFGQSLTAQTSQALQSLDQITTQALGNVRSNLQNAPTPAALPSYQAQAPISVAPVSPFSNGAGTAGNATAAPVGGSVYSLINNNQNG